MRCFYFAPNNPDFSPALSFGGIGLEEIMPPGFVDRPQGFGRQPAYLLVHFHDGALVELAAGRRAVPPGTTVFWEPTMSHFFGRADRPWNHSWLIVRGATGAAILDAAALPARAPLASHGGDAVLPALEWMLRELETYQPPDPFVLEHCLHLLARSLARAVHGGKTGPVPDNLRRTCRLLETRIAEPLTLADLARATHLSVSRFSELFRQHFGQPPMRYVEERRLHRAAHLLTNHALNIGQIAAAVGYPDQLHFSRRFRRRFGLSPTAYRQRPLPKSGA